MSYFSVKRYIRQSNHWEYISYYDSNNNFRGKAIFETREDAERYLDSYQTKIDSRLNVYGKQITASVNAKLRLKVVAREADSLKKQLGETGLCPPGHECSCTPASGVFHDHTNGFNINTGCTSDKG